MAFHQLGRITIEVAESSNARSRSDGGHRDRWVLTLDQLKRYASFGMDTKSLSNIIKIHEVDTFKRSLSDVESESYNDVFRGLGDVDFHKTLNEHLRPWRNKAVQRRREGKVSLLESVSMMELSDERGRRVVHSFEQRVMELGSRLSKIMVSYLLMFLDWYEGEVEMRGRYNQLEAMIPWESLEEERNFFTKKLLRSIECFSETVIEDKKWKSFDDALYEERDLVFLGSIFSMILIVMVGLFYPFFSFKLKEEEVMELGEFLTEMVEEKMSDLILSVDEDHQEMVQGSSEEVIEKKERFIRILDDKFKELWYQD